MADAGVTHMQWDLSHGVAVVEVLTHKIDQPHLARELGAQLHALVQENPSKQFLLDLHRVRYLSSTAFAGLLEFWKTAKAAGVQVRICAMDPDVRIGADIISLGRLIPIHEDKASALTAFASDNTSA
ncbi:MAG TPA: STAS domain-containing protein [Isosphaeraceae bacterium]|jgi:anti-anti-sigma factor|nr:STAS domain-containing protein [Isosphaeraceae bacterium]